MMEPIDSVMRRNVELFREHGRLKGSVDKVTGAVAFSQVRGDNWLPFEIDLDKRSIIANVDALDPRAYMVMQKTLQVLSDMTRHLKNVTSLETLPQEMEPIRDRDILISFRNVDRMGAEALLRGKSAGTYLFRKDEFASILEKNLRLANHPTLHCTTLTYVQIEGRIADHTLVEEKGKWCLYNDNPTLNGQWYPSLRSLLEASSSLFSHPLT